MPRLEHCNLVVVEQNLPEPQPLPRLVYAIPCGAPLLVVVVVVVAVEAVLGSLFAFALSNIVILPRSLVEGVVVRIVVLVFFVDDEVISVARPGSASIGKIDCGGGIEAGERVLRPGISGASICGRTCFRSESRARRGIAVI